MKDSEGNPSSYYLILMKVFHGIFGTLIFQSLFVLTTFENHIDISRQFKYACSSFLLLIFKYKQFHAMVWMCLPKVHELETWSPM